MKIPTKSRSPVQLAAYRRSVTAVAKLLDLSELRVSRLVTRIEAGGGQIAAGRADFAFLSDDQIAAAEQAVAREHALVG